MRLNLPTQILAERLKIIPEHRPTLSPSVALIPLMYPITGVGHIRHLNRIDIDCKRHTVRVVNNNGQTHLSLLSLLIEAGLRPIVPSADMTRLPPGG